MRSSSSTSSGHASNSRFFVRPHAATPRTNGMNRRLFLGGLRPPRPSRGWGNGETRFPHSPARGLCPHLPAGGGVGQPGCPIPLRAGCALPNPPTGRGDGETRFPYPCARAVPAPSRGRGRGATRLPHPPAGRGRGATRLPHPPAHGLRPHLPAGGGMGEPGSPIFTLATLPRQLSTDAPFIILWYNRN